MRKLFTLVFILLFSLQSKAQYFEAGLTAGATNYIGDLQADKPDTRSFGKSGGAFVRWNYSPIFAVKGSALYASFTAADKYASGSRRSRNLESITTIYEVAATGEVNLTKFDVLDGHIASPYLFAGVAGFYFNPQVKASNGVLTDLQTLGTEGQFLEGGKPYSRFALAIPAGIGFKMAATKRINLGFELGFRYTFTDYLDDVSDNYPNLEELAKQNEIAAELSYRMPAYFGQKLENPQGLPRGNKIKHDFYYYGGVTISYNLGSKEKMEFNKEYRAFFKAQ